MLKTFEQADKSQLKYRLHMLGWRVDQKAGKTVAGQLHSWFLPSPIRGQLSRRMTLRNAAKAAGLVSQ